MRTIGLAHSFQILLLLLLAGPVAGRAADNDKCAAQCAPIQHRPAFVEIDANTGEILGGSTLFTEGEKVQVIISRKNPFKYVYRAQIVSSPLDQAIVGTFLRLIPNVGSLLDSLLTPGAEVAAASIAEVSEQNDVCPSAAWEVWKRVELETAENKKAEAGLKVKAAEIKSAHEDYTKFVDDTDKDNLGDLASCTDVCTRAHGVSEKIDTLTELGDLKKKNDKLAKSAESVDSLLKSISKDIEKCELTSQATEVRAQLKSEGETVATLSAVVKELEGAKQSIVAMGKIIRAALADDNAFREEHFPFTGAGPTNVRITLFRRNLREENAAEKQVASLDLTVGQSRFSLSAGVGFSTVEDVHILRDGKKFGEENRSSLRPSFAVMLNAQLGHFWRWNAGTPANNACPACPATPMQALPVTWGVSTGLVVSNRNNTTQTEFILGPSLGLLDNSLFTTFGLHLAQVDKLGGGFEVGQEIPADLTGEPPVKRDWAKGFMLAVTYKMR